jgi:uncharacterized membrane protein YhaH (DUF805 family)
MTFGEAVKSGFDHYTKFDGRANRPAFWWWTLFAILVGVAAQIIGAAADTMFITWIVGLGLFLPDLSVAIRRLHDTNRSGWWVLLWVIPIIGWIVLLIFYLQDSDPGPNDYGPPMEAPAAPAITG